MHAPGGLTALLRDDAETCGKIYVILWGFLFASVMYCEILLLTRCNATYIGNKATLLCYIFPLALTYLQRWREVN